MDVLPITKAELARQLEVSRTYVTLLTQGKRQPSQQLANKIKQLQSTVDFPVEFRLTNALVGKGGLEPHCQLPGLFPIVHCMSLTRPPVVFWNLVSNRPGVQPSFNLTLPSYYLSS